jgi:DNA-binding XRE family transcriptional regulator
MAPEQITNQFLITEKGETNKDRAGLNISEIEYLVGLLYQGNAASLAKARQEMGITLNQLSALIDISADTLNTWETGAENPSQRQLIAWRLKTGDFLEEKMSHYLGTDNPELIMQLWEIMWRLNDLTVRY